MYNWSNISLCITGQISFYSLPNEVSEITICYYNSDAIAAYMNSEYFFYHIEIISKKTKIGCFPVNI